jgi:HK97 gp10 family phage protein
MGFDVSELRKLSADLGKAGPKATALASVAVRKTALDIEADAKTLAPVDTGNLRNSIGSDIQELSAEVGPTASYSAYLEYGTSKMSAQPFMGPAFERRAPGLEQVLGKIAEGIL